MMRLLLFISILFIGCNPFGGSDQSSVNSSVGGPTLQDFVWDFNSSSAYTFSSTYIQVSGGQASLKQSLQVFDDSADFSQGTHDFTSFSSSKLSIMSKSADTFDIRNILPSKSSNLTAYYRMDNDSWIDYSGNNMNGTEDFGNAEFVSDSAKVKVGTYAGEFTNGNVKIGAVANVTTGNAFAISGWFRANNLSTTYQRIVDNNFTDGSGKQGLSCWIREDSPGYVRFRCVLSKDGVSTGTTYYFAVENEYYHFVFTSDGTTAILYVNGAQVSSMAHSANTGSGDFYIGSASSGASPFIGQIDELAFFNTNLTATEVSTLYKTQAQQFNSFSSAWTPHYTSMVAHWNMEFNWKDSASSHDATSYGGATYTMSGKIGSGATLDGVDDYLSVAHSSDLNFNGGEMTIAGWINSATIDPNTSFGDMIAYKGSWNSVNSYSLVFYSSNLRCNFGTSWAGGATYSTNNFEPNVWYHIACVGDSSGTRLYVNGELVASSSILPSNCELPAFKWPMIRSSELVI